VIRFLPPSPAGQAGFTLVEVLVAVFLLAVVMGIGFAVHGSTMAAVRQGNAALAVSRRAVLCLDRLAEDLANAVADEAPPGQSEPFVARRVDDRQNAAPDTVFEVVFTGKAVAGLDPRPAGTPLTITYTVKRRPGGGFRLHRQPEDGISTPVATDLDRFEWEFVAADGSRYPEWPPDDYDDHDADYGGNDAGRPEPAPLPAAVGVSCVFSSGGGRYAFRTMAMTGGIR